MITWIGIPYARADCVRLTRAYLRARGYRSRDPRTHPDAWEQVGQREALAITYKRRSHIAPIVDGYVLEARKGHASMMVPLSRLIARMGGVEFWRPRPC